MQAMSKNDLLIKKICALGENDFSDSPYHHRKFYLPVALLRDAAHEGGYTFEQERGYTVEKHAKRYFSISNKDGWEIFFLNNPGCCVTSTAVCNNKNLAKNLLGLRGIPVPKGQIFVDEAKARKYFLAQKQLQVVKPCDGTGGQGVTAGISDELNFSVAWDKARKYGEEIIIEDYAWGEEVRVVVLGGRALAAICRIPANVIGDGVHSISELVKLKNIAKKKNPDAAGYPITSFDYLAITSRSLDGIPASGEHVRLSTISNMSVGGDAVNVMGYLHQNILDLAVKAGAAIPGATLLGFDILVRDFTSEAVEGNATIIEVNYNASLAMACFCTYGPPVSELPGAIIDFVSAGNYATATKNHGAIRVEPARAYIQNHAGDTPRNSHALLKQAAYARNYAVESLRNDFAIISHSGRSIALYQGMCSRDRLLGHRASKDRIWSKKLLKSASINTPTAIIFTKTNRDGAWKLVQKSAVPMVVKPVSNVGSINELIATVSMESFNIAFDAVCAPTTKEVLIEEFVPGNNYRVLVVGNSIRAVLQRMPAYLLGNKKHKIDVLVESKSKVRASDPCSSSEPIKPIQAVQSNLASGALNKSDVSEVGSRDVTDFVHPDFAEIAVKVRRAMYDLVRVGFDLIAEDISKSPNEQRWAVVMVTANPNLCLHHFPHYGTPRDVSGTLLEYLFQDADNRSLFTPSGSIDDQLKIENPTQIINPKPDEPEQKK